MKPSERRETIVKLVQKQTRITVEELAERLSASRETIRRDLSLLADEGRIRKVHGSALYPERLKENAFQERMYEDEEGKRQIARYAAPLFHPGDSIFIDTGTTTLSFAEALAEIAGLTVITNSSSIAQVLARGRGKSKVFLLGGEYHEESCQNLGTLAVEQINRFRADHAVLSTGALSESGAMNFSLDEANVAAAMAGHARTVTLLASSAKLGREALFQWTSLSSIDRLVTDKAPDTNLLQALKQAHVQVLIAPPIQGLEK